jgi:hypothetical protein
VGVLGLLERAFGLRIGVRLRFGIELRIELRIGFRFQLRLRLRIRLGRPELRRRLGDSLDLRLLRRTGLLLLVRLRNGKR